MSWGVAQRDKENQTDGVLELRGQEKGLTRWWLQITRKGWQDDLPPESVNLSLMLGTHMMT